MRRHSLQKFGISCAVLAKRQILACRHKPGIHLFGQNLCCKTLWLCGCSLLRKRKLDQSVDSQTFKQASFSSLVVSSLPSDRPNSTAGVGSKVNTHAASPYFFDQESLPKVSCGPDGLRQIYRWLLLYLFQIKVCCSCNDFQVYFLLSVLLGKIFTGLYHSFVSSYT